MSVSDLIVFLSGHTPALVAVFVFIPLLAFAYGYLHPRKGGGRSPHRYVYAVLVYLSCAPGIFAVVLSAYSLFFLRANMLQVNLAVYLLPIVSMIATLVLIGRHADFDDIPGFDRLIGLCTLLAITFVISLAVLKTRIWVLFGGSFLGLIVVAAVLFALLKAGARKLFGRGKTGAAEIPLGD